MDNKSDYQLLIIQSSIEPKKQEIRSNKKDSDQKMTNLTEEFKTILAEITDKVNTLNSLPT